MKFIIALAALAVNASHAEVWDADACDNACDEDSSDSVSLLQKHVRPAGRKSRDVNAMNYGGDDVGAIAALLTHEIDDAVEQAVRNNNIGRDGAHSIEMELEQVPSEMLKVHVPVVAVEITGSTKIPIDVDDESVEDGDEDEEDDGDQDEEGGLSDSCTEALEKLVNDERRVNKAKKCESKHGHSDEAIRALQEMDTKKAIKSIEQTFKVCGGLSKKCAQELAPDEMLKMRLSGVTMEQECVDVAAEQDMNPNKKAQKCQTDMGQDIVDALVAGDVSDALDKAQDGLAQCNNIDHPCDFQLAPLLVGQLIQSQEEAPQELQPGGMLFSNLVDAVIRPSYYQAMLLQL